MTAAAASMVDLLEHRAAEYAQRQAYVFLSERGVAASLSFGELAAASRRVAHGLARRGASGDRVLLVCPPGLDFIVGFFGCLLAGMIAVPLMVPRRTASRDASASIIADCAPRLLLSTRSVIDGPRAPALDGLLGGGAICLSCEEAGAESAGGPLPRPDAGAIAFLQYTSGSTSAPKGVMVHHRNLLFNLEMIRGALGNSSRSTYVTWIPLYHDMGLVLNVLQSLYVGANCVLMAPVTFMQRPLLWLKAISDYRAEVAGAPNFAYDHCVERFRPQQMEGVDLSSWAVAYNGAEPVRADTLARFTATFAPYGFRSEALYPCYGMAEATLLISGGARGGGTVIRSLSRSQLQAHRVAEPVDSADIQRVVGCGRSLVGERVLVVDPETREPLPHGHIGEIWVQGANVCGGYWQAREASAQAFGAKLAKDAGADWLRTGDLGFMDADGELFITGRIKDVIIIRGNNHYPQDLELTAERSHPALQPAGGAAFLAPAASGQERLILVHEIRRVHRQTLCAEEIAGAIREAVADQHELSVQEVVLIPPGTIPKTTSGKIQRRLTRQLWLEGRLPSIESADGDASAAA